METTCNCTRCNPPINEFEGPKETVQERLERQRAKIFDEKKKAEEADTLRDIAWMQVKKTQSQSLFWDELFDGTSPEHQRRLRQCNQHLNDPIRQGEIVILPASSPLDRFEEARLSEMQEEAKAASEALGPLSENMVTMINRHFELLDYYVSKGMQWLNKGAPSDPYAYAGLGVGVASATVEKYLKNINEVLLEINNLYCEQVALASRTGGMNYGTFVAQRAKLFEKLDLMLIYSAKQTVYLRSSSRIKNTLKLSTKSVLHDADLILKKGFVPNLGKRIANIVRAVSVSQGVGKLGLILGASSAVKNIYDACNVDGSGDCGKVTTEEIMGFSMGTYIGGITADLAVGGVVLILGGTVTAPILALATVGAFVVGGAVGGIAGGAIGKTMGDVIYDFSGVKDVINQWTL